jgi:hypothetical protein
MLIGHEVGHALFTTDDYIKEDGSRALHGYMNVIEDVRIEKKIKNKYPGLRASFLRAYRELNERDFFEIKGRDMSKLLLIDRINLYYKCGFNCGVKFTTEEMEFVRAADRCDSIEDVYLLAKELLAFTMEERKKFKQSLAEQQLDIKMSKEDMDDLEEVEYESDSDMFDDIEEDEDTDTKELAEDEDGKQHSSGSDPNAKINDEVAEEEVESTVLRMGFVKRAEFEALAAEVVKLGGKSVVANTTGPKRASTKKATATSNPKELMYLVKVQGSIPKASLRKK